MAVVDLKHKTTDELEATLGTHLRTLRLRRDLTQQQLAERAGLALGAVKNAERGRGARVRTLLRMLKALGRADWIDTLAPEISVSPLQMLRSTAQRQRAYSPRRKKRTGVQSG
jgi:transcriptional regulator with XRE-family HTH domain